MVEKSGILREEISYFWSTEVFWGENVLFWGEKRYLGAKLPNGLEKKRHFGVEKS